MSDIPKSPTLMPDKPQLISSGSYERRPLAPPLKFKRADMHESLRSIISYESNNNNQSDNNSNSNSNSSSSLLAESPEAPRGRFLLEHEKEASDLDLLDKGKGKVPEISSNNTISSNLHVYDGVGNDESSPLPPSFLSNINHSPISRRRGFSQSLVNEIAMATINNNNNSNNNTNYSANSSASSSPFSSRLSTPMFNINNNNNNNNSNNINNVKKNTRSNSVSSVESAGSTDSLIHHPLHPSPSSSSPSSSSNNSKLKKKSLLATIFFSKPNKTDSPDNPAIFPEELESKPKQVISQHSNFHTSERKLYTRKPFQKVESFQTVKDKKYKAILEDQQQRVLTEVPRMIEHQLVEEAYPIIVKMCQEYIKNLGEKHEITRTAIEKLNLMASFLGRECEYPL